MHTYMHICTQATWVHHIEAANRPSTNCGSHTSFLLGPSDPQQMIMRLKTHRVSIVLRLVARKTMSCSLDWRQSSCWHVLVILLCPVLLCQFSLMLLQQAASSSAFSGIQDFNFFLLYHFTIIITIIAIVYFYYCFVAQGWNSGPRACWGQW